MRGGSDRTGLHGGLLDVVAALTVGCLVRHGHAPAPTPPPQDYDTKLQHGKNRFVCIIQQIRQNRQIRRSFNILSVNAQIVFDALHHIRGETGIVRTVVQTVQVVHQFVTARYLAPQFAQATRRLDVAGIQRIGQLLFRIVFNF